MRKVGGSIPPLATTFDLHGHGDCTLCSVGLVRFLCDRAVCDGVMKPVEVGGYVVEFVGGPAHDRRDVGMLTIVPPRRGATPGGRT